MTEELQYYCTAVFKTFVLVIFKVYGTETDSDVTSVTTLPKNTFTVKKGTFQKLQLPVTTAEKHFMKVKMVGNRVDIWSSQESMLTLSF